LGIPSVVIQRKEFVGVTSNAVAGLGFSPEIAMVVFPVDLFLVDSDISPIKENFDKFVYGLTKWEPKVKKKGVIKPSNITVEGKDYAEALSDMNRMCLQNNWGDGLPLLPATEDRVQWILRGTDLSPETVVGKILPQGRIASMTTLATALAMAGGRPEYLPVLTASIKAMLDPSNTHGNWQATTSSVYPVAIVSGPIAKQIRLNSGFGLVGPSSAYPAGGVIGRAMRLLQQDVGGAVPGVGTMAQYGGMRYTNAVFAEDEAGFPPGWQTLSVERFKQPKGTNTVTFYTVNGATNIYRLGYSARTGGLTAEQDALEGLYRIAQYMNAPNMTVLDGYDEGAPGILLLASPIAKQYADLGWTKEKIRQYLWENTKIPVTEIKKTGFIGLIERDLPNVFKAGLQDPWPITSKPENIVVLVAGGRHPTHAYWMQAMGGAKLVNVKIDLPAKWNELIKEAERDLGPVPAN
jgi:hypothetical protein